MATIKSYTDLEQSKQLAEILPLESADMWFANGIYLIKTSEEPKDIKGVFPCWSLAALLSVIPQVYLDSIKQYDKKLWRCCAYFASDWHHSDWCDNPVDACYEMILKMNELNSL
jgi:hypothetical protein